MNTARNFESTSAGDLADELTAAVGRCRDLVSALVRAGDREQAAIAAQAMLTSIAELAEPLAAAAAHPRVSRPAGARAQALRLAIGPGGSWFSAPGGRRVCLERRRALRRIVERLAKERRERPGRPLSVDELLAAGWPGEQPQPEAGARRVYVAVSTLRKLGLARHLRRVDAGYLLAPEVPLVFERARLPGALFALPAAAP